MALGRWNRCLSRRWYQRLRCPRKLAIRRGHPPWLQKAIAHFYPHSTYAQSLGADFITRAKTFIFHPPAIGARVTCPHCGAPHAAPAGMSELIAFTCLCCGAAVRIEPPKIQ